MFKFELSTLENYNNESLLDEVKRVASLLPDGPLTVSKFDELSRVASGTLRRRFGSWHKVLDAAGLQNRFDDRNCRRTKEEIVAELQYVASVLGSGTLTKRQFVKQARFGHQAVTAVFGNWGNALRAAGLSIEESARRFSNVECFENLLRVWTYYGRQPKYSEMDDQPSAIKARVYARRWSSWRRALGMFVEWTKQANEVNNPPTSPSAFSSPDNCDAAIGHNSILPETRTTSRNIPLRLRFQVMRRDEFKCCLCGVSPALRPGTVLEVDHKVPWSKGGETVVDNLQTHCQRCNNGKSNLSIGQGP